MSIRRSCKEYIIYELWITRFESKVFIDTIIVVWCTRMVLENWNQEKFRKNVYRYMLLLLENNNNDNEYIYIYI